MIDLQQLKNHYNLKGKVKILKDFDVKGGRFVLLIEIGSRKYILKVSSKKRLESEIQIDTEAIYYLNAQKTKFAPQIITTKTNALHTKIDDLFLYLLEYIEGKDIIENPENFNNLAKALYKLHQLNSFDKASPFKYKELKAKLLTLMPNQSFKLEYDAIINSLPELSEENQVFIHTDITCLNAKYNQENEIIFLDFDDAGMGSKYIDISQPLITQFVRFYEGKLKFNKENSIAFYKGYQLEKKFTQKEKELIFEVALFMQLMQITWFGEENEIYLWQILQFAIENKVELMATI